MRDTAGHRRLPTLTSRSSMQRAASVMPADIRGLSFRRQREFVG
jgi:hypothetical protein